MTILPEGDSHSLDTREAVQLHSLFVPDLTSPLTVIKGHAQLIGRRTIGEASEETAQLQRSLEAIEVAVQRITAALAESPSRIL